MRKNRFKSKKIVPKKGYLSCEEKYRPDDSEKFKITFLAFVDVWATFVARSTQITDSYDDF
jgi:hypothetical protein